jgi:hypothetical protein
MKIKNREKFLVIAAISVIVLLAGDRFIVSPLVRAWKARANRIAELTKSLSKGMSLLDREKALRSRWENMKTNALPTDSSVAESELSKAVERWSQESGISISGFKPQAKSHADDYMTLECRADGSGNMQALTRFLYNLEKDHLAFKVEDLEISARDNAGVELALVVRISGLQLTSEAK